MTLLHLLSLRENAFEKTLHRPVGPINFSIFKKLRPEVAWNLLKPELQLAVAH
jgi:hypothetical protein